MAIRFVVCVAVLLLSACVSSKKYQALTNRYTNLSQRFAADTIRLSQKNEEAKSSRDSLLTKYNQLADTYLQLKNDSLTLSQTYRRNKVLLDELFDKYDKLDKSYKQLSSSISTDALNMNQDFSQKQKDLLILEQKLLAQQSQNDRLNMELQEREARFMAFENSIQKMNKTASELKIRLEKALGTSKDTTLKVEQRLNKVVVHVPTVLLFTPNSSTVSVQGNALLKKLVSVYKNQVGYSYTITTSGSTNPDISFPHLNEILIFIQKEGVTFDKIITSVYYTSKATNSTKKGIEKPINHTVEFIAEPKTEAILQILQNN